MRFGLLVIAALILSALAVGFLMQDTGTVVITFRGKIIEMSFVFLCFTVLLLFFLIWLTIKLIRAPRALGDAAARYRSGRAGQRLTRGVIEVAEGNFAKGERLLARAAGTSEAPLLNYLQAARAAHLLGQDERRDTWLKQAYENLPGAANAVLLTQAELQIDQEQYEQALATLRKIEDNAPNHGHALNLLGRLYYQLEDWAQLGQLLPKIAKHARVDPPTLQAWSLRVQQEKLAGAADADAVTATWKQVAKELRQEVPLLESYFAALVRTGQHDKAEKEIAAELKQRWRGPVVRWYGLVESSDSTRQLKKAEGWLQKRGEDADLLLAAARLCLHNELWGKARSYLETAIGIRPSTEAYQEYGRLLNQLGEGELAAEAYRDGLALASGVSLPAIPHLDADDGES